MENKGPAAKTKTVLKTACKAAQLGNMQKQLDQNRNPTAGWARCPTFSERKIDGSPNSQTYSSSTLDDTPIINKQNSLLKTLIGTNVT